MTTVHSRFAAAAATLALAVLSLPPIPPASGASTPEPLSGFRAPDGYAGDFADLAIAIDEFWVGEFRGAGGSYRTPDIVVVEQPLDSPCGPLHPDARNAGYCRSNDSVYLFPTFMQEMDRTIGDFAPVVILAHEWGHHVQNLLNLPDGDTKSTELQADCLAGGFVAFAETNGLLESGDFVEAIQLVDEFGDPPWLANDSNAHGSPRERVRALLEGYLDGPSRCRLPLYQPAVPPTLVETPRPTATPTIPPTPTPRVISPPTATPIPTPTSAPTSTPTPAPSPTATPTPRPSPTPSPSPTPTPTPTPTPVPPPTPSGIVPPEAAVSVEIASPDGRLFGVEADEPITLDVARPGVPRAVLGYTLDEVLWYLDHPQYMGGGPYDRVVAALAETPTFFAGYAEPDRVAGQLDALGWRDGRLRVHAIDDPPPGSPGYVVVAVGRFRTPHGGAAAVPYLAERFADATGRTVVPYAATESAAAVVGPAVNGFQRTAFVAYGPYVIVVTGVAPDGDPAPAVDALVERAMSALLD